jgi:hypothetical protein
LSGKDEDDLVLRAATSLEVALQHPASWTAVSVCPIFSARLGGQKEDRDELPEASVIAAFTRQTKPGLMLLDPALTLHKVSYVTNPPKW